MSLPTAPGQYSCTGKKSSRSKRGFSLKAELERQGVSDSDAKRAMKGVLDAEAKFHKPADIRTAKFDHETRTLNVKQR